MTVQHSQRRCLHICIFKFLFPLTALLLFAGCAHKQSFSNKVVVITGASSGLGKGVALKMAEQGDTVVLAARRTELLEELAEECERRGGRALALTTDVASNEDVEKLAQAAIEQFGQIDVWINNAGVGVIGPFWEVPVEDYSRLIDVNLKGVIYGSHAALQQFRSQGYGTLVNIGSIDSEVPHAYHATYSATKAAVLSLGRTLNEELRLNKHKRIKVATVLPWGIDTPFWRHAANYTGGRSRMAALDGPEKVVNAIVGASVRPREEVVVGWKAKGAYYSHKVLPDLTERISGNIAHRYQVEKAPPAEPTKGSLYEPMQEGTGISDGVRERFDKENEKGTNE